MRSYSSLLCHILGSHPQISGYAEMHQSYRGRLDLMRLRARVFRSLDGELDGYFVLDKILHNFYPVSDSVINNPKVHAIFLIRNPVDTVASVTQMGRRLTNITSYTDQGWVTDYYENRLRHLAQLAKRMDGSFLFLRAEALIDDTSSVLRSIRGFLGLEQRLAETYSLFKHTGQQGWGDDSPAILQGRIVRGSPRGHAVERDQELVLRTMRAYENCCRALESRVR